MRKYLIVVILTIIAIVLLFSPSITKVNAQEAYQDYNLYWGDNHWHSTLCDGQETMTFGMNWARDVEELDFTVHTPHIEHPYFAKVTYPEWINTYLSVSNSYNDAGNFVTLLGWEWSAKVFYDPAYKAGHHNVYFRDSIGYYGCTPEITFTINGLISCLESNGFPEGTVLVVPHHVATNRSLIYNTDWDNGINNEYVRNAEIYSKWGTGEYEGNPKPLINPTAEEEHHYILYALNSGHKFAFSGGSDSHITKPGSDIYEGLSIYEPYSASGLTVAFINTSFTRASLFDAMYNRHIYATDGKRIQLLFSINGHLMGEEFDTNDTSKVLSINATSWSEFDPIEEIVIVKGVWNGSIYDAVSTGYDTISVNATSFSTNYIDNDTNDSIFYYLRLTTSDGYRAWASPIWVNYSSIPPTPTPTPTPIAPTEDTNTMLLGFVILPLGLLGLGLARKEIWLQLASAIAWFGLGMYIFITFGATVGEPVWIMALTGIIVSLAIFIGILVNRSQNNEQIES